MRHDYQLLVEIIDETLRRLPKNTERKIADYELRNSVPALRRTKRVDAYCFEKRRSARSRRSEEWLDLQANNYEKQK
jgi:hypothetical protein